MPSCSTASIASLTMRSIETSFSDSCLRKTGLASATVIFVRLTLFFWNMRKNSWICSWPLFWKPRGELGCSNGTVMSISLASRLPSRYSRLCIERIIRTRRGLARVSQQRGSSEHCIAITYRKDSRVVALPSSPTRWSRMRSSTSSSNCININTDSSRIHAS